MAFTESFRNQISLRKKQTEREEVFIYWRSFATAAVEPASSFE